MLLQDVGHRIHRECAAQVLLEAQGAYTVHTRCSGHDDQRGNLEVRRELVLRRARMATASRLPILECRRVSWADDPGLEDGAQWPYARFVPQGVCAEEKLQPFPGQLDPPFLTGMAKVPEVCVVSACEGCWLKFLYFKSCPY